MKFKEKGVHFQGHRGARGLMPENTIESCIRAIECGVDGLEIDIVVSEDKQIVVSHEPWMTDLCNFPDGKPVNGPFTEGVRLLKMPYQAIREFDCGSRGNARFPTQMPMKTYKPTLSELVEKVLGYCLEKNIKPPFFNIEIKSQPSWDDIFVPLPAAFVALLKENLGTFPDAFEFYVSSFDPRILREVKRQMPNVLVAFLTEKPWGLKWHVRKLGFKPDIFSPYFKFVFNRTVRLANSQGIKIVTWTVNDETACTRLIRKGVSGIITDFPNAFNSTLSL